MSDTPRTDALWSDNSVTPDELADLSRELERRVAELEGLRITGTHFFSDFVGVAVNLPLGSEPTIGGTLGQAMPAKEWGPYKLQPDGFYRLQAMPGGGK